MVTARSATSRGWLARCLDLEADIHPIEMSGAEAIHLTVFSGPDPLGTVVVPCSSPVCSTDLLRLGLEPLRFAAFEKSLRRRFDRPDPRPLPSASVVVCTRGRPDSLRRCLSALSRLATVTAELIVIDNGSGEDGTAEVVAEFDARYVYEDVPGLDRARNRGAAEASGEIVLYTDDDVEVHQDWAARLLQGFRDPVTAAVTGLILPASLDSEGQLEFEEHAGFVRTVEPFVLDGTTSDPTTAGRAGAGASMAFRRDYLLSIAGFPEELDGGQATKTGGDTYALYQVLTSGLRVRFEPRALAFHHHRDSRRQARSAVEGYGTGTISYFAHGARTNRDPAAAIAGVRWAGNRTAKLARSAILTGASNETGYLATECRGMMQAPAAYRRSRHDVDSRPCILEDRWVWDPVSSLANQRATPTGKMAAPTVSVVIPTLGDRRSLATTLDSLAKQDYDRDLLEVIVADDSPDGSAQQLVSGLDTGLTIKTLRSGGGGAGAARNAAVAAADGELLVFLDDDIRPRHRSHLTSMAAAFNGGADAVLGPILPAPSDDQDLLTLAVRNWWMDQSQALLAKSRPVFTDICTGNLGVARATFEKLGGFRSLPRREDWEFGLRLLDGGADVRVVADAAVDHIDHPTVAGGIRRRRLEGQGDVELARLHLQRLKLTRLGSWFEFSPRHTATARAMIANPDRGRRAADLAAKGLPAVERVGYRKQFSRLLSQVNDFAYWAGVGEATGGLDGWFELLAQHRDSTRLGPPVSILELTEAADWDRPVVNGAEVAIHHKGELIGVAPLSWGGTPWTRDRFVDAVISRYSQRVLEVEAIGAVTR